MSKFVVFSSMLTDFDQDNITVLTIVNSVEEAKTLLADLTKTLGDKIDETDSALLLDYAPYDDRETAEDILRGVIEENFPYLFEDEDEDSDDEDAE